MFDTIIASVASRFGISAEKSKQLLGMLIALIFNEKRGGPAGFVDLFRSRGLGDMVNSWIGNGPNQAIAPAQLEQALGADVINGIASRVGIERGVAASAMSALLPDIFNNLTENGQIPTGTTIPERFMGFMDGIGDFIKDLGAGVFGVGAAAVGAVAHAADRAGDKIEDAGRATLRAADRAVDNTVDAARDAGRAAKSGIGRFLPWILLLGAIVVGALMLKECKKEEAAAPAPAPVETAAAPAAATATANSTFGFANTDGKVTVNGTLASEAEKTRLMDAIKGAFGAENVSGDITVDTKAAPAGWMDKLVAMLPDLKAKGLKFNFDGDKLNLDTSAMSEADRFAFTDKFRNAFSGFEISGLWDKAMAAFAGLKDGFTGDDLVKALDLSNVFFDTGKATITRDSMETLTKAAEYIKKAPAGTKIEVSGHTDNTGDAAANMTLSQQRADAVVAKLQELGVGAGILTAKGYGQDKPVADNKTEEGRAQNRRIDYAISK